jgi:glutathione S-transferase
MSIQLYFSPGACSFVPHLMLEKAGVPFEPIMVKLHKGEQLTPEFKAINPNGQVPVLIDEGEVLTQILAMVGYLDKRFPQAHILPGWLRIPPACGKRSQESRGPDDRGI